MKLSAAVVVATALVLPAAQAAQGTSTRDVLSLASSTSGVRLAWVDALRLTKLARPGVDLGRTWGSWTFSPDRSTLAIVAGDTSDTARLRFVNVGEMRVWGQL